MEEESHNIHDKVTKEVEQKINEIIEEGVEPSNLDNLGKLIDIHKDIANEEYWKVKEENYMRYRGYGNDEYGEGSYGRRGVKGTGPYSRYRDGASYGRRGVPGTGRGRYRGHDVMDEMAEHYGRYSDGKEEYRRSGHYGAKDDSVQSLEDMMKATYELICVISEEAESPEEMEIIKKYSRKISEL